MRRLFPGAVLLAEVLLFFRQVLFSSEFVIPYDLRGYHLGPAFFAAKCLREGALPLWDPYTYCGFPLYANLQAQVFYPPALLASLAPLEHLLKALEWQIALHVWLGGAATYWLLRRQGLRRGPALLGGTIFQLGGYFASQAQHLGAMCGGAWLPLTWASVLALRARSRWRWTALLAFSLAMAILAGFPAVTAVVVVCCGLLALSLVALRRAPARLLLSVALACAWAALLAAIQLLPTLELIGLGTSLGRGEWAGTGGGIPLRALLSLVWPNASGIFDLKTYALPYNPTFLYLYCGLAGLLLALCGAAFSKHKLRSVFAAMTLAAALWMLGESTPVGRTVFAWLPTAVKSPLYAEFAMAGFVLGLAALAALGAQRFFRGPAMSALVALTAVELIAAGSGRFMNTVAVRDDPGISAGQFEGAPETLERVRALVNRTLPPARVEALRDSVNWATAAAMLGVPTAHGNDPLALGRLMEVRRLICEGVPWLRYCEISALDSPLLDLLNVRYLISYAPSEAPVFRHPKFHKAADLPGHQVYENPNALPRFFLVNRVRRVAGLPQALAALRSAGFDPRAEAVVEDAIELPVAAGALPPVRVLAYRDREVELEVDVPAPAFLVSSETFYPGWRASLDGQPAKLVLTNGAFRGLSVPAGRHRIHMRFAPAILAYGAALSAPAWLLLLLTGSAGARGGRRRRTAA